MRPFPGAPPIGAHIQIKGGLARGGLAYTDAVGARAVQVFVGNPRGWKVSSGDPRQDEAFTAGCAERGVPSFVHTPFLVNVHAVDVPAGQRLVACSDGASMAQLSTASANDRPEGGFQGHP